MSGHSWETTIQDGITNFLLKSDITLQSGAKCRRPVWGFFMYFFILGPGPIKCISYCRLSLSRRKGKSLRLIEKPVELNHSHKWTFPAEGQPYRHPESELLCTLFYCIDNKMVLNESAICVDLREMAECHKWCLDRMTVKTWA